MKTNSSCNGCPDAVRRRALRTSLIAFSLFALAVLPAAAQSVLVRSLPLRITVPKGVASNVVATLSITLSGTFTTGVNFAVTGVPTGCTGILSTNNINVAGTHTATLNFSSPGTLAQGEYDMAVEATGEASYRLPIPVRCAYIWSGIDFTNAVSTNFTSAGNWLGGGVPPTGADITFRDLGGVASLTAATNAIISADKELGSIRFASDQSATRTFNIELQSGATVSVTGTNGFTMLRDSKGSGTQIDARFTGNGKLVVSNSAASFSTFIDAQANCNLDLQGLNNLYVEVARMPLGDYRAYPNMTTNGYTGGGGTGANSEPSRFLPLVWLARTNVIKVSYVDPNNYDDLGVCNYALSIANYHLQGSTSNPRFTMGVSNAFFLDSACFSQSMSGGSANNYNFLNGGSTALFRGTGGLSSRMSVFAIGDARDPDASAANVRGQVNFANVTNCTVDALIDRLFLAVDRTNHSGSCTIQGALTFGSGTIDVNDAYLGYQRSGDCPSGNVAGFAGPEGTVNVNSNATFSAAVFRVNRNLNLGYTTASAAGGNPTAERCFGKVNISGGTMAVSNIVVGGVTKITTNSTITMGSGRLFVTNTIGAANGRLAIFTATNNAQITLLGVSVGTTNVFVKKLNMPGAALGSAVFNIPTIGGSPTYPVTIPVISYNSTLPADPALYAGITAGVLPSGVRVQTIVDNTTDKVIEFTFATGAPNLLAWRGNVNNVWDATTKNWVTVPGGVSTNFVDGDSVIFDDNATGSTSISIPGTVIPGQALVTYGIAMTNITKSYSFSGGNVSGGATFYKTGSGNLTNDATFTPGLILAGGNLAGSGTFGATTLGAGSVMTAFTGTINGGLSAANASVTVVGTVSGGLNLLAGALTNNGTINGNVVIGLGSYLTNGGTINVILPWRVTTNSTLVNNGIIAQSGANGANQGLTVDGTLKGNGKIYVAAGAIADARVTMAAGGTLMIGNQPNEITSVTIATRVDFLQGSAVTFDVDTGTGNNDKIILEELFVSLGKVNFGAGNNPGGTFIVNRTTGPAFNLATTLNFFDQTSQVPDNNNQAVPGFTPAPAPGLAWDTSFILTNLTLKVTGPPQLTNVISGSSIEFTWGNDRRGWRLERNVDTNSVGIDATGTNWQTVQYTYGGTNVYHPDTNNLDVFYFRSVQNVDKTNAGVYFRLNYP